jgi:hypothetical protein
MELILIVIFCADILISFFVGYYDQQGLLVMGNRAVAVHYVRYALLTACRIEGPVAACRHGSG